MTKNIFFFEYPPKFFYLSLSATLRDAVHTHTEKYSETGYINK